jgi:hypothetical protein
VHVEPVEHRERRVLLPHGARVHHAPHMRDNPVEVPALLNH